MKGHYGLGVGDKVEVLNHPAYKDEQFEVIITYRSDKNFVRVRYQEYLEDDITEFDWCAEWCKKIEQNNKKVA